MVSDEQLRGGVNAPPRNVLILGVGNLLLTDDGFGVHVINALKNTAFPENITLLEAGTVSHQLIPMLREIDVLIVVDVVEAGDTPGSIFKFSPDDLQFKSEQKFSLHQISLIDVLHMAEMTGGKPKTIIIAVQPKDVSSWSLELSNEVRAVIPKVVELIFEELKKEQALPA
ncbi:MAG: HyaD/HybD family hydrogenase maturation endopeptidase [Deltaproteobacteria bacterium]|nr:HyaD/HybD family hydrogenase maturation endopeptidase [Deltaproteobacteria bacterium]